MLREFISSQVLGRIAAAVDAPDRELRASLIGSQIVGLVMARYIVRVEPLASADAETVVAAVAPDGPALPHRVDRLSGCVGGSR